MDGRKLYADLCELADILDGPPKMSANIKQTTIEEKMAGTKETRATKISSAIEEKLDYLRFVSKYIVFDLEATRRENDYLRKMLEEDQNDGRGREV